MRENFKACNFLFSHIIPHCFHFFSHFWNAFFHIFFTCIFKMRYFHIYFTFFSHFKLIIVCKLVAGNGHDKHIAQFRTLCPVQTVRICFIEKIAFNFLWLALFPSAAMSVNPVQNRPSSRGSISWRLCYWHGWFLVQFNFPTFDVDSMG
jgi:hypothetical protein